MLDNKRAQIGETMTWIVATIIIIVILIFSIFIVSLSKKNRSFELKGYNDLLVTKSFMGYLLSDDGKGVVFEQIKNKEGFPTDPEIKLEKSNVDLAIKIFPMLYSEGNLNYIWLGIVDYTCKFESACTAISIPFGDRNKKDLLGKRLFYNNLMLNKNSFIELIVKIKK